ncbi:hypothetical protein T265_04470 [Opisthorchis viverrini]|uniref:N-acetyltransferase domain-containing protein n=1 Tax=Opisthorchis viverrini TaxID=6198 RepID=A0A075AGJ4_OPIVI|nr:hypothetical protein T265_04470 [Opisthorchis viverrini]KER28779.1 hypothetical protein T265_04470 [Opisthorchis viverrini]
MKFRPLETCVLYAWDPFSATPYSTTASTLSEVTCSPTPTTFSCISTYCSKPPSTTANAEDSCSLPTELPPPREFDYTTNFLTAPYPLPSPCISYHKPLNPNTPISPVWLSVPSAPYDSMLKALQNRSTPPPSAPALPSRSLSLKYLSCPSIRRDLNPAVSVELPHTVPPSDCADYIITNDCPTQPVTLCPWSSATQTLPRHPSRGPFEALGSNRHPTINAANKTFGSPPSEAAETVLKCLSTNCPSLFNKPGDVKQSACLEQPSIIALTETWLTPGVSDAEISINGYSIFRDDSKRGRADWVALYLHAALPIPIFVSDTTPATFAMHCGSKFRRAGLIISFSAWSTVALRVPLKIIDSSYKHTINSPPTTTSLISCCRLFLVPYCGFHVPRYHGWMQSEALRRATSSDLLNLEEEYEAQRLWTELDDRLTFILLTREKLKLSDLPSPSLGDRHQQLEIEAMIGDVNLFLTPVQDAKHGAEFEGELSVMIAEEDFRGQGLAAEAVAALLQYSSSHLPNKISSLVAKVSLDNPASLRLFGDHLGFCERSRCEVFNQVTDRNKDSRLADMAKLAKILLKVRPNGDNEDEWGSPTNLSYSTECTRFIASDD